MANLADGIFYLQSIGVADVLLPFLLVFTITFAIFQKSRILGDKAEVKRYNTIIALVLGLSFVMPHILWGTGGPTLMNGFIDPVVVVNNSLPSISVVIIAIVMGMLMLGVFGAEFNMASGVTAWMMGLAVAVVIYVFGTAAGYFGGGNFPPFLWFLADPNTQMLLVTIVVFVIIIFAITHESKPDEQKEKWSNYVKAIGGEAPKK